MIDRLKNKKYPNKLCFLNRKDFIPRVTEEKVKNCTKVPKTIVSTILQNIVQKLLSDETNIKNGWNSGDKVHLSELSTVLDTNLLQELKSECGGLQTLLRNHNNIFIVDKGYVRLRNPAEDCHHLGKRKPSKSLTEKYRKTKPCWFYNNHPNGCPAKVSLILTQKILKFVFV